jgi:hypothetical protein
LWPHAFWLQDTPDQPFSHEQDRCSLLHEPWPLHEFGHTFTEQSSPAYCMSQAHIGRASGPSWNDSSHSPWSEQAFGHSGVEQTGPDQPALHLQAPLVVL